MDPRVHISAADLEALHTAQVTMAASLDALAKAALAAHSVQEQISSPQNSSIANQLAPFSAALKVLLDGTGAKAAKRLPSIDEVTSEATQLYDELQQADALPSAALQEAAADAEAEGEEALTGWEEFKQKQLPALNNQLRNVHLPPIDLNHKTDNMPDGGDED
jgi:hypothetical protein